MSFFGSDLDFEFGDRVRMGKRPDGPRGVILQHFDKASKFVLVRWDSGNAAKEETVVDKRLLQNLG